jgi:cell division protein FtsB
MSSPLPQSRVRVQRIAEAAVERARLTVVPRIRSRAPRVPFVTLVSLILVGGVVGLLMFNTTMQQNSFHATALEAQADELSSRQQTLELELERLRDPQRVAERAQAMGMVPAANPTFLRLGDGTVLGKATPAGPEDGFDVRPPAARKPPVLSPKPIFVEVPAVSVVPPARAAGPGAASPDRDAPAGSNGASQQAERTQGNRSAR